jgi:hypothetical protein
MKTFNLPDKAQFDFAEEFVMKDKFGRNAGNKSVLPVAAAIKSASFVRRSFNHSIGIYTVWRRIVKSIHPAKQHASLRALGTQLHE